MGPNMSYFKIVILKGSLDNINRLIKVDIDIIQKTVDKTKINLDKIDQDITNFGKTLDNIKIDMQTVKSDEVQPFYNVANTNFDILKKLNSVLINNNSTLEIPVTYTPTSTSSVNIPNSLPINKIISTNKDLITSSDTSKLYNTVEGLTNYISSYYNNMPTIEGLTDTDMTNINTLMTNEKALLDNLADFNSKYERYIHCNDPINNCTNEKDSLRTILLSKMTAINSNLTIMKTTSLSQTSKYQSIHNSILSDYDKVLKIRNDLDMKVKQLYDPENSKIADFKHSYDSTIYSGIIISALATSMLYYIFTEL